MRYYPGLHGCGNTSVLALVQVFVDIALHRRGPEHLPASTFLLGLVVVANLVVTFVSLKLALSTQYAIVMLAVDTLVFVAFIWGVLKAFNHEKRIKQTATALFGTDTLLSALSLPLLLWARALDSAAASTTAPTIFVVLLVIWSIDVSGYVLSRAIGRPYVLGVFIMIGYVLFTSSVQASLFPTATA